VKVSVLFILGLLLTGCPKYVPPEDTNTKIQFVEDLNCTKFRTKRGAGAGTLYLFEIKNHMYLWDTNGAIEHFAGCECECMGCLFPDGFGREDEPEGYRNYTRKELISLLVDFQAPLPRISTPRERSPDGN